LPLNVRQQRGIEGVDHGVADGGVLVHRNPLTCAA
jgi:hypothetical protein